MLRYGYAAAVAGLTLVLALGSGGLHAEVAQTPLTAEIQVPANLVLVPSVEFPTLISAANLGNYDSTSAYVGYFDPGKCYRYVYAAQEAQRHFAPASLRPAAGCAGKLWDGRFMNWVATQTIDPFRKALTGGYRVRDTPTETWLEKADFSIQGRAANFETRRLPSGTAANERAVNAATAAQYRAFYARVYGLGARMYFSSTRNLDTATSSVAYNPDNTRHTLSPPRGSNPGDEGVIYEVSIRVKVCDPSVGLEENCVAYANGFKPEGLLQKNNDRLRYSIFGYLNNGGPGAADTGGHETAAEGGVLRARQKFIGPFVHDPLTPPTINPAREWDPVTGVLLDNPDPADASSTGGGVRHSGVINYLNRFGQMKTGRTPKYYDNVSELYYAAQRYIRGLGNVKEFSELSKNTTTRYRQADGFPVIAAWDDPIRYQCQSNTLLGIGDTNTWTDKNLPGATNRGGEPAKPAGVSSDTSVDVVKALKQIWLMEGFSASQASSRAVAPWYNGVAAQQNSAYIAALAYLANTTDIRPDDARNGLPGKQTLQTYWVDVVEKGDYKLTNNQYVLAAKYGGFEVPSGYETYNPKAPPLLPEWWWNGVDYVNNDKRERRPRNFFAASDATRMVASLEQAFKAITQVKLGAGSAVSTNGGEPGDDGRIYSATYQTGSWRGDLSAYEADARTGVVGTTAVWSASTRLDARPWRDRKILIPKGGALVTASWSALSAEQRSALGEERVLQYLLGDRSMEGKEDFRLRAGVLGDFVNSSPVYVGPPNPNLYWGKRFQGADRYAAFVQSLSGRRPALYASANDGMLHGFDAASGDENVAVMPGSVPFEGLQQYARQGYQHRYLLDGELTVADAYVGGSWKTILVGTRGRAGPGVFALDITRPGDVRLMWELDGKALAGMGAVIGKPLIAQVADGDWRVVLGNGADGGDDMSRLYSIALDSAQVHTTVLDRAGGGAFGARPWDADGDGFAETAYVGDAAGGLFRVDLVRSQSQRLFTAQYGGALQPITATPLVGRNPEDGMTWVFFGTGALLETRDLANMGVQSWYGIRDRGQTVAGRSGLLATRILAETSTGRALDKNDQPGADGWVIDFISPGAAPRGERMVLPNQFRGRTLVGTTRIPDARNPCNPSGSGYFMAIDPFTGGRLDDSFFDMDGDGTVGNSGDLIDADGHPVPSSGFLVGQGPNGPGFLGDWLGGSLEDGGLSGVITNPIGNRLRRASWRELRWRGDAGLPQ